MNSQPTIEIPAATSAASEGGTDTEPAAEQVVEETLVEDVSIDGMCGVY